MTPPEPHVGLADGDPPIVCRVTPDGDVICETVPPDHQTAFFMLSATATSSHATTGGSAPAESDAFDTALEGAFPGTWGPKKRALARKLMQTLAANDLPDARIPRRTGQCAAAVADLLLPTPPSILLFNYSELPANVMGAYFLNRAEYAKMARVVRQFEHTVEP